MDKQTQTVVTTAAFTQQIRDIEKKFELDIARLLSTLAPSVPVALELKPDPKPAKDTVPAPRPTRVRRPQFQIDRMALVVAGIVYGHPRGIGMGEIMKAMAGVSKAAVMTSVHRAIDNRLIRMTGAKRGAKYTSWSPANDMEKNNVH